jgi:hypothetical protein
MAVRVATSDSFPCESSEKTCTMLRSDSLSTSWNTYFRGASTLPGICTGSLNWNCVFLFHSSASTGRARKGVCAKKAPKHSAFNLIFIVSPLSLDSSARSSFFPGARRSFRPRIGQVDIRIVKSDFEGSALTAFWSRVDWVTAVVYNRHSLPFGGILIMSALT